MHLENIRKSFLYDTLTAAVPSQRKETGHRTVSMLVIKTELKEIARVAILPPPSAPTFLLFPWRRQFRGECKRTRL